jgi:hypothetical protein
LQSAMALPLELVGARIPPPLYEVAVPAVSNADHYWNEYPHPMVSRTIVMTGANCYSARSASITLTRAARAAGRSDATIATVISRNAEMATGHAPGIFISAK